ncbi:MAG TPA: alpha-hydroxy acid oxidase [Thermoplasmata archaeon]|nr:alpha-hydroxy acid oxidase [Thermoplasmata archaeon]
MSPRSQRPRPFPTLGELEEAAERAVDERVWGYIQGGAGAERTCRANLAAFDRWTLVPDELAGVRSVDLRTSLLGQPVSAPFFIAPSAYQREVHPGGEAAVAAAAAQLGVLGVFSTLSSDSLEAIARAGGAGPRWFQLYLQPTLDASLDLVRRAELAGYSALVVTVDTPVLGSRDRQERSGFALRQPIPVGNGEDVRSPPRGPTWDGGTYDLGEGGEVTWETLAALHRATSLPLVVKGLLGPASARRAVDLGARAVVVSNHGGRQLDLAPAALDALPSIVAAVGRDAEVYVDGGIRRGSDVIVALALGARAVGLGRPILWALAVGGQAGVDRYLRSLGTELANSLVLLGRARVGDVDRSAVQPAPATTPGPAGPSVGGAPPTRGRPGHPSRPTPAHRT